MLSLAQAAQVIGAQAHGRFHWLHLHPLVRFGTGQGHLEEVQVAYQWTSWAGRRVAATGPGGPTPGEVAVLFALAQLGGLLAGWEEAERAG
jgi:hypothetical protein